MSKQIKQVKSSATDEPVRVARPVVDAPAATSEAADAAEATDAPDAPEVDVDTDQTQATDEGEPTVEAEQVDQLVLPEVEHYWKPTLDASVEVGWSQLSPEQFYVQLLFSNARMLLTRARAGAESGQQLLVSTIMDRNNREVVVGVRTPDSTQNFLSGNFELRYDKGVAQLWLTRLRYPGGYLPEHQFT